jgi:hypothetical protein
MNVVMLCVVCVCVCMGFIYWNELYTLELILY